MALALFVSVTNNTMVNVAIPIIQEDLTVPPGRTGWIITGYSLVFAVGIPLYARASDLFSFRRTFSLGLAVFAAGSLVCALVPNLAVLVGGRALQAAGASAIPALAVGSVARVLPAGQRGPAYGLLASSLGLGAVAGPVLGGLLTSLVGWRSLFYATLALLLLLLLGAFFALPGTVLGSSEGSTPGESAADYHIGGLRRLDLPGGVLLAAATGLLLFGVTWGQTAGFVSPMTWGSLLLAALSAVAFAMRIRSAAEPFVSPTLFDSGAFLAAASVGFLAQFANVGSLFLAPMLLIGEGRLSALSVGLLLAPGAAAVALLAPLAGRLSDRLGPRAVLVPSLAVMLLAVLFLSSYAVGRSAGAVALGLLALGVGYAGVNSPTANAASATVSREVAGASLGIYQLSFFLGSGSGPALLGAFLASRRGENAGALNPLYSLDAAAFSDAFLLASVALVLALLASTKLGEINQKKREDG
jgi:MFS family permease